jgi:cytochrome c-type biogenesis protein CcmH
MGLAQEGKKAQATAAWQKMLETLPPDSPWLGAVQQALGQGGEASVSAEAQANGPDVQQMVAAQQMPPQDRQAMIETMVAGLDSRLKQSPRDLQGWTQLIRSYAVLGKPVQARDALKRAIAAFGDGGNEAKQVTTDAAALGVAATE